MPYIVLIAGIPASGKTTYGRHIAEYDEGRDPFCGRK